MLKQYHKFVKGSFKNFILPFSSYADLSIPGFRNNRVSVEFIVQQIKNISRRINFQEKVKLTKLYFFGENEMFDLEFSRNIELINEPLRESYIVFPTLEEQKK